MPQSYAKSARSTPESLRLGLGYVPARVASGAGTGSSGIVVTGGPSGPTIYSTRLNVTVISTATYILTAADAYTYLRFTNAGGCTVTVPTNATAAWDTNVAPWFALEQGAAGKVDISAAPGVTINTLSIFNKRSYGQYAVMQLIATATDVFTLFGAQEPV